MTRDHRVALVSLVLGLLAGAGGCAKNPVSGRPELVLVSAAEEKRIGAEEAEKVARLVGVVEGTRSAGWVEAVGARLSEHAVREEVEYRFHLVNMVEPNAFALPGGHIYISRGLIALVNSEDELAGILGHEIGHVEGRHAVRRLTVAAPFALATSLPGFLVGIVSPTLGKVASAPAAIAGGLLLSPYNRSQESQADQLGVALAARGGWDPEGLSHALVSIGREERLHREAPRRASFFDSHPSNSSRIESTRALARRTSRAAAMPIAADRAAVLSRLDGLRLGEDPARGVFSDGRFLHASLGIGLSFPPGWTTQNTRTMVGAAAPDGESLSVLRVVGEGDDPMQVAREREARKGTTWLQRPAPQRISGLSAAWGIADVRIDGGPGRALLYWIAHRGLIYELAGVAPRDRFSALRPRLEAVGESFAPLRPSEAERIRDTLLRVVEAQGDESLASLVERTGSVWSPEEIAVANGLVAEARLRAGQLVKVALEEPWPGSSR